MKIKTSELTGAALDWAVAVCQNVELDEHEKGIWFVGEERVPYTPSTDWAQGGPIMEREGILPMLERIERHDDGTVSFGKAFRAKTPVQFLDFDDGMLGPTPLIAAMRCYVASKLGDEVEVPDGLV